MRGDSELILLVNEPHLSILRTSERVMLSRYLLTKCVDELGEARDSLLIACTLLYPIKGEPGRDGRGGVTAVSEFSA